MSSWAMSPMHDAPPRRNEPTAVQMTMIQCISATLFKTQNETRFVRAGYGGQYWCLERVVNTVDIPVSDLIAASSWHTDPTSPCQTRLRPPRHPRFVLSAANIDLYIASRACLGRLSNA